jgi:hypothetical protein
MDRKKEDEEARGKPGISSSRDFHRSRIVRRLLAGLGRSFLLWGLLWGAISLPPAFAKEAPLMTVVFPDKPHQGKAIKIRVHFSHPPLPGEFYRLEADVDKTPVALSDLSEAAAIWVTLPAQTAGTHTVAVIWKNPPGKTSLTRTKVLTVLP